MFRLPPGLPWWRGGLRPRAPLQPLPVPGHQPGVRGAVVAAGAPPAYTPPAAPRPLQVSLIIIIIIKSTFQPQVVSPDSCHELHNN